MTALLDLTAAVNPHVDGHDEYDYQGLRRAVETFEELGGGILGLAFGDDDSGDVSLAGDVVDLVLTVRQRNGRPVTTSAPTNSETNSKRSALRCRTPTTGRPIASKGRYTGSKRVSVNSVVRPRRDG